MSDIQPAVYLETSFIGMLTARPSLLVTTASMQYYSKLWWETRRNDFRLVISETVDAEISRGDRAAVVERKQIVDELPVLEVTLEVLQLADKMIREHGIPPKAANDALHIACAAVYGIRYLLTWNCRHIANEDKKPLIDRLIQENGYNPPVIITPQLLLGDNDD